VLEGLDGVGKSTVALRLAEILSARHMVTPPAIMLPARQWFVQQDNHMRRAYYMVTNVQLDAVTYFDW
jgi:thymidylate kinase